MTRVGAQGRTGVRHELTGLRRTEGRHTSSLLKLALRNSTFSMDCIIPKLELVPKLPSGDLFRKLWMGSRVGQGVADVGVRERMLAWGHWSRGHSKGPWAQKRGERSKTCGRSPRHWG